MDEKLKRLGLNEGTSVLSGYTAEQSQQYLQSIRDIKKERDKTQKEKAYRAYMLNEGEEKGDKYLSDVKQAKNRQAIIDNASHVLRGETEKAAAISRNRELRASEEQEREKQLKKEAALRESMLKREQEANAASRSAMTDSTSVSNRTDDATTEEFCRNLARGVINLSMLVSDNRHLPSTDTFGNRVRSEHENLEVTQWRTWVRECLYGATQPQEKQRSIDETPVQEEAPPAESSSPLENEAEELLRYVAELQEGYSEQAVGKTTSKGLSMMNELVEILRKEKLDTLRREHEAELGEEVVPRWTQRLPPAGCFVHGGELSGTHLLRDTIENVHETNTRQNSTPPTAGATNTSRAGVCVRSGEAQHLFVTPRTLLNAGVPQTTAKGGASTAGSKAKKGLRSSLNFTEEDEKKDWEQLFEMVCKELIHAYWNNLSVISENDVPPPPSNTADGAAGKHARGLQESVLASDLITVHLVGFPETKEFYQSLLARLSTLLETTQVDILAAIDRKRNDDRLDSSPPNKPKQSVAKATVGKGKKSVQANVAPQESPAARVQPKVLPPVCLLGFFLHHDLPTGLQRLQECSPNPGNASFPYFHDVFFPDTKVQPPTASSPFSPSATQDARNSIASSKPNNNSTMPAELVEWSRQALRSVLLQQNKKAEQWCHTWGSSLSLAAMANYQQNSALAAGGHYAGGAGKGDKVKRTGDRARTAERERRASVATSIVSSSDPSSVPQEAKPYQFPRVLFFVRKVDVSDAALQQFNKDNSFQSSEEAESAVCLYPFPSLDSSASETELERWRLVYCLTAHLVEVSDPSKMRFLSKDTLIPDQLPTGFRLNDYLFPKEVLDCMSHTAQLHNDILVKNKSLKSSPFVDDSVSVPSDFHSCCVLVEQEAFRVAYHFPLKCADMINSVRFPSEGDNRGKPKSQLFKEIDAVHHQNLQSLSSLQSQYQQKLKNSGCFVLCCAVKYSVISLARVINGVCALLVNSMAPTATAAVSGEQAPGEAFMAAAPPVTFDVVASTVAALLEQDRPVHWDGLQPYIGQVSAAATSVMEKFVLDVAEQYALSEDSKQFWVEQTQKMVQHLVADTFLWDEAATLSKFAELVTRERDGSAPGAEYPAVIAPWLARCAALLRCMGRLTEKTRLATESWLSHQYNQASSLLPQAEGTVLAGVQDLFSSPARRMEKSGRTRCTCCSGRPTSPHCPSTARTPSPWSSCGTVTCYSRCSSCGSSPPTTPSGVRR
ncbi:hypothetical protein ADEAN_000939200 [Angomonas deanei]|uniref:Uncharacterized protein n=1 Tax=Angomonas deanei TaxID=59799 RepID=A0A7G2CRS4_9TRYP|nr:hypothetical protein ADEAN_000939200 [Angomonas deanei]